MLSGVTGSPATKQKSKVFANDHSFSTLLEIPKDFGPSSTDFCHILLQGGSLCWLQVLENASGEILKAAFLARNAMSQASEGFDLKRRLTTTDAAPSNFAAERKVLEERTGDWSSIHQVCLAHQIALAHTKSFSLAQEHHRHGEPELDSLCG